jgi:hypothetical protein
MSFILGRRHLFVYIRRMAVNFIKINLFRQSMLVTSLPSLWNVYTQILRHNSEDKGENQDVKKKSRAIF